MVRGLIVAVLLGAGATACEPPPSVAIQVTTTAAGPDAAPGDGVCEMTAGAGDCSLEAAVAEGNTEPRAALTVPAGIYAGMELTVTGQLSINWGAPVGVELRNVRVTVAEGASLEADGLRTGMNNDLDASLRFVVSGKLQLRRSVVMDAGASWQDRTPIVIEPTGWVSLDRSVAVGMRSAVRTHGTFAAIQSTLLAFGGPRLETEGSGVSHLQTTVLARGVSTHQILEACSGTFPVSHGYNVIQSEIGSGCGPLTTTDRKISFLLFDWTSDGVPYPHTPWVGVDMIPMGSAGCSPTATDMFGNHRGVDGNGDGIAGCDVGPIEYQP